MEVKMLDFTGKWCSSCIVLDKILESEIIPKYKEVRFIKVDIEKDEDLTKQHEILSVPTLILFKNSVEIWRKSGTITKEGIIKELEKLTAH